MKMKWGLIGFLFTGLVNGQAWSAEQTFSVGSKAAPLTQEGGTSRAMSMGSAFVGVAEGSEALLWNPAGLAYLSEKEIGFHHTSGIGDSIREIGIFGTPVRSLGGFAASLDAVSNGSFEGRDQLGNQTGNYHAGDLGANLGWGKNIVPGFAVGAAVKTNHQYLAGSTYSAYAADLGLLWNPFSTFKFGATYANLNIANSYSQYALDSAWHIGASYRLIHPLLVAMAGELQPGGVNRIQLGGEYTYNALIAIRGGYQFNYPNADLSGTTGFTLGAGFHLLKHIDLDYAFVPEGDLGAAQRISVIYKFGCAEPSKLIMKIKP